MFYHNHVILKFTRYEAGLKFTRDGVRLKLLVTEQNQR